MSATILLNLFFTSSSETGFMGQPLALCPVQIHWIPVFPWHR